MIADKMVKRFLDTLQRIEYGNCKIELPNGQTYHVSGAKPGPHAHLKLNDVTVIYNIATGSDIAFAEDYRMGKWESNNIAALIEATLRNSHHLQNYMNYNPIQKMMTKLSYLLNRNTKKGSRKNIRAHYDLGNQFYQLWLDPTMTYSSALFKNDCDDLKTAQNHKYDRILQRIGNAPKKILEIGCGWGGFAERSLETSAHHIKGITISPAQYEYARNRLKEKSARADIRLQDYRELKGHYDAIISIEMFEAIGEQYWNTYFKKIKSLLKQRGKAVIQTIVIDDAYFDAYRRGGDAIRSYIFPGGMLPSPKRFKQEAERAHLHITDEYFFGQDYAKTLNLWLQQFEQHADRIREHTPDETFIRLWRFYLSYCIAAFSVNRTNVMQVELRHA